MKKLLFFLLVPLISLSQVTYKDIMSISTKNTFLKAMLDNKYSQMESDSSKLVFGLIPTLVNVCSFQTYRSIFSEIKKTNPVSYEKIISTKFEKKCAEATCEYESQSLFSLPGISLAKYLVTKR